MKPPNTFPFTDAHRSFIARLASLDLRLIYKEVAKAFGISSRQATSVAIQWERERKERAARKKQEEKPLLKPLTDAERFRLIAGEHAISPEEIQQRRIFYGGE